MITLVPSHHRIQCIELQGMIWLEKQPIPSQCQVTSKCCNCTLPQHIKLRSTFNGKLSNLRLWIDLRIAQRSHLNTA
ncbi:hypothetical protein EWP49_08845 [Acinetobacter baumannii]|nr:hypothetical protein EWO92_07515 [Acinetobacter baumannii]RYL30810.1 hypothetical protein EWO96_07765 [Acinetobacter baumannii]RYL44684.1 hypothetical protein EWP49_08845 [Acinetobacter baumannii]TPT18386.1 hypothetical protein FJU71_08090 [Acinetobacter baumannii]